MTKFNKVNEYKINTEKINFFPNILAIDFKIKGKRITLITLKKIHQYPRKTFLSQ